MGEEFTFLSVSTLQKMVCEKLDFVAVAKSFKQSENILNDVILMFDEIFLLKCEQYFGEMFGTYKKWIII